MTTLGAKFRAHWSGGTNPFEVGDILTTSWGYDQTNIDFYEVVKVTAKSVYVLQTNRQTVDGKVAPVPGSYQKTWQDGDYRVPKPSRKLVQWTVWRDEPEPYIKVYSFANAYPWDGTPRYDTIAAGHPGH